MKHFLAMCTLSLLDLCWQPSILIFDMSGALVQNSVMQRTFVVASLYNMSACG